MSDSILGSIQFGPTASPSPVPSHGLKPEKVHRRRDPGPTPQHRAAMFEALESGSQIIPAAPLVEVIQASIAISLKRIADHLESERSLKRIADQLAAQSQVSDELRKEIER